MRPRRDRWLSLLEVAEVIAKEHPRIAALSQRRKREHVRRLIRRVERVQGERLSKRVGRELWVSRNGADALRKWDPSSLDELGRAVSDLHQKQREQQRQLNGHGAKLREHRGRLTNLEEKQRAADMYLQAIARIDRSGNAA